MLLLISTANWFCIPIRDVAFQLVKIMLFARNIADITDVPSTNGSERAGPACKSLVKCGTQAGMMVYDLFQQVQPTLVDSG